MVHVYFRCAGVVHVYWDVGVLQGHSCTGYYSVTAVQVMYACAGVQESYRGTMGTGVGLRYRCTGAVQVFCDTGVVQGYSGSGIVQLFRGTGVVL
jgi:hypothetical protein